MNYLRNAFLVSVGVVLTVGLIAKFAGFPELGGWVYQAVYLVGAALVVTGLGACLWFLFQCEKREKVFDGLALMALGAAVMTQSPYWATLAVAILVLEEFRPLRKNNEDKG